MLARYTERCIEVRTYQFGKLEFTASVLAMLGHLSQRERQGMLARYTERCIEVRFYQFGKLEFTAPTLLFRLIALFHSIIWLSYMQEQSRQTLPPGLKLSYDHPVFPPGGFL